MAQFIWALLGHQKIQDDRTYTLPRTPFLDSFRVADNAGAISWNRDAKWIPLELRSRIAELGAHSKWFEVRKHIMEFSDVRRCLVRAHQLESFPQIDNGWVFVSTSDCLLRNPLEDLHDCSVCCAHHDRYAFGDETLGAQRRKMVPNQFEERLFETRPWLITCN